MNARRLSITCLSDAELLSRHDLPSAVLLAAAQYCTDRRAVYIVDPPARWEQLLSEGRIGEIDPEDLGIYGQKAGVSIARNAAVYFPHYVAEDPLHDNQPSAFAPGGMVAGVIAASSTARGVWKAPAGIDAGLAGANVCTWDLCCGAIRPIGAGSVGYEAAEKSRNTSPVIRKRFLIDGRMRQIRCHAFGNALPAYSSVLCAAPCESTANIIVHPLTARCCPQSPSRHTQFSLGTVHLDRRGRHRAASRPQSLSVEREAEAHRTVAWARGSVPTPHGVLRVAVRKEEGNERITLEIPPGIEEGKIFLEPPRSGTSVLLDGHAVTPVGTTPEGTPLPNLGTGIHSIVFTPQAQ